MFGMGGMNPKNMEKIMKQLGMQTTNIEAQQVIIKCKDKEIIISNPNIQKISLGGQESFQITGSVSDKEHDKFSQEDIQIIMEKTGCTKKEAEKALQDTGDIAEAIILLESKN